MPNNGKLLIIALLCAWKSCLIYLNFVDGVVKAVVDADGIGKAAADVVMAVKKVANSGDN